MDENEAQNPPIDASRVAAEPAQSYLAFLLRIWVLKRGTAPVQSRHSVPLLIGWSTLWLLLWITIDRWDALPDPQFLIAGAPLFAWYALAILTLAALLRWRSKPI